MVTLPADVLGLYPRISRYNSPYPAHDAGCAIDLYPDTDEAPSPVSGEVVETRTVRCPEKSYAVDHDHLIVIDTGDYLARMLHVRPLVESGDSVAVGETLGEMVRSGFFAPWVSNHIHLGFREHGQNAVRASGSLPLNMDIPVEPVAWDGTGTVVETDETWALLDSPEHPAPGECVAGLANDDGSVLDGGIPHYEQGIAGGNADEISLFGAVIGERVNGRTIRWRDITLFANERPIKGLSLWLGSERLGVKVVCPDHTFSVADTVRVSIEE